MSRRSGRKAPSDPQAILARRAIERGKQAQADRLKKQRPELWGVSAQIIALPTSSDVTVRRANRNGAVISAKRSDPFDLLHAAGGLKDEQHAAARRLFRDWCLRAGVRDDDQLKLQKVDGGRPDPSAMVTEAMVDAGRRIAISLKGGKIEGVIVSGVGPVNARLLEALISPMVDEGRIIAWRGVVQRVTGETERHAQGAMVRQACEALRLVYDEVDERQRRARGEDEKRGKPGIRSFGSFGPAA